jgi:putative hydrolase of the HAD superfamily
MSRVIIFDIDGMLVHGDRFSTRLSKDFVIGLDKTSGFFKHEFQDCLVGKADLKEELAKRISEWGWKGSVDELLEYWLQDEHNVIDERFKPVILDLRSRGVKCYLGSNNEKYRSEYLIKKKGLGDWFDKTFFSTVMGYKKPDREFFEEIFKESREIDKSSITLWDNDEENLRAAREFGFKGELYTNLEDFIEKNRF